MRTLERTRVPERARRRAKPGVAAAAPRSGRRPGARDERLKAELRRARASAAHATDAARRRLERDLHDGAQQQLVALALDLRLLQARVAGTHHAPLVEELGDRLAVALAGLRELARGLHPAIITSRGLRPAPQGLADRAPLPVIVDVEATERPPAHVEATAYFTVAEALTNVARHAQASQASGEIRRCGEDLVITVADDGVGGADTAMGTGLLGLRDRLAGLDGTLTIESEAGAGTRLVAVIPSARARRDECRGSAPGAARPG
jgi:signal transduction histidine kinase